MSKKCIRCDQDIEQERLEALPETEFCVACAKIIKPKKVRGIMMYENDAPTTVCVMSSKHFEVLTATACYDTIPESAD